MSEVNETIKLNTNEPRIVTVNMVLGKIQFAQNEYTLEILKCQIINYIIGIGLSVEDIKLKYIEFKKD